MVEPSGTISQNAVENDYDRQFEEDLERACSLSLETHALEKFRKEKLQKDGKTIADSQASGQFTIEKRPSSTDRPAKFDIISRPRPGSFNTGGPRTPQIIAPPPPSTSAHRRNSATQSVQNTPDPQEADLINFNSPSPTEKKRESVLLSEFPDSISFDTKYDSSKILQLVQSNSAFTSCGANSLSTLPYIPQSSYSVTQLGRNVSSIHFTYGNNQMYRNDFGTSFPPYHRTLSDLVTQTPLAGVTAPYRTIIPIPDTSRSHPTFDERTKLDVRKVLHKSDNSNLIDLNLPDNHSNKNVSVLEAFDPLLTSPEPPISLPSGKEQVKVPCDQEWERDELDSPSSSSYYDAYDPFDYMYSPSRDGSQSDPVYAAVIKEHERGTVPLSPSTPPPLPPRNSAAWNTIERKRTSEKRNRVKSRLYENVQVVKRRSTHHDSDLKAFCSMVKSIRGEFPHDDITTNSGIVYSPIIDSTCITGTSVKVVVHSEGDAVPVTFTCDVSITVEHVILHVVCELENDVSGAADQYYLKVWGLSEYLTGDNSLACYEYVHQCLKLEQDVKLVLVHRDKLGRPLARTVQDDRRDCSLTMEDLLPNEPVLPISHDNLLILLETLEREMDRISTAASELSGCGNSNIMPSLQPERVVQAVKAICALMGNVETTDISESVEGFKSVCMEFTTSPHDTRSSAILRPEISRDFDDYSVVSLKPSPDSFQEMVISHCDRIRDAVQGLIETYCQAFRVDFQLQSRAELPSNKKQSSDVLDSVLVHLSALHRPLPGWNHLDFIIAAQIFHGTRPVGQPVLTRPVPRSKSFYERVVFDFWLNFEATSVCMLPRESRIVFVLYGRTILPPENGDTKESSDEPRIQQVELGWAAIQFFNHEGVMVQGSSLLSLWPAIADRRLGPAPAPGIHPHGDTDPILWVEFPDYGGCTVFPSKVNYSSPAPAYDFNSLDHNTQQQLLTIIEQDSFNRPIIEDREVLWEKRHYLRHYPEALPKVLLAAHSWDWACLGDLHHMVHSWSPLPPISALQLLLPCFPDSEVRSMAVSWIRSLGSDELVDYLPQLVQALKHETWEASPLARFLLERALISPRVAHCLYWLLSPALPGDFPQNTSESSCQDDVSLGEARYYRRLQLMLRALLAICGEALRERFLTQQLLVKTLHEVAENVKTTKESLKMKILTQEMETLNTTLHDSPACLPLSPSLEVTGVQAHSCFYFPSNTLPLKINFTSSEAGIVAAIFKVGDDLRQDVLTMQMVRIMDKLWLKEGLDLKMVTFECVPTGNKRGMIEMVTNAETLRKIQVELGLTGSFKDRPIAEWLAKHNPSTFEYERAVENFTASCAGYSVATYVLGICDRHNDNIMLKTSGHLFHIDFGKFLGDVQMFGNFKRDRTPFVLTSDMAYVINGGDKPTAKFHHFVDLCCQAFNIVRKHGNLLLNLFALMVSSGIPGVTVDAVSYVQKSLCPELSNPEAAAMFARMIEGSLKSWFTQFNFFLHNLSQLRFSGDHDSGELLSFIPRTYSMQQDGKIKDVTVHGYQKRYDPEKYYVYILKVERENQPDPLYLFRSYKEFCELHQKLCILFPLAKCYSLPSGLSVGRSNIKQVAEKRRTDIDRFLKSLFAMAPEISHSDIVYTFFHPLLRDQQEEINIHAIKVKERKHRQMSRGEAHSIRGQLKLSLHYQRGTLMVMVHHARSLPLVSGGQEPSPYVKVYLLPDPTKATKRKTKVVRRNRHPTFMEMLEYRMPLEVISRRDLQATVWNHDPLQENEFLGCIVLPLEALDLTSETIEWYPLGNMVSR